MRSKDLARSAAIAGAAAIANSALAQAQAIDAQRGQVEEITVTAQKRNQTLQSVPIVVTAVTAQLLKDAGIKDIKGLAVAVPGLTVTSDAGPGTTVARIRGIGTVGDNIGLESSVGINIDGVYRPRNGVAFEDLGELVRIEVLKGPQGTVFGQNSTAGIINVLTKEPSSGPSADLELTAESRGGFGGSAALNGPLFEDFFGAGNSSGRLYFAARSREGWLDIAPAGGPRTDPRDDNQAYGTLRGQWAVQPNNDLKLRLIADFTRRDEQCCGAILYNNAEAAAGTPAAFGQYFLQIANLVAAGGQGNSVTPNPSRLLAYANQNDESKTNDGGVSLQADWNTGWNNAVLTSITAWRDYTLHGSLDADYSGADLFYLPDNGRNRTRFDQFSEELRLSGEAKWGNWLAGAYYQHELADLDVSVVNGGLSTNPALAAQGVTQIEQFYALSFFGTQSFSQLAALAGLPAPGTLFLPNQGNFDQHHQTSNSFSAFTNETVHLIDRVDLVGGIRYTHTEKHVDQIYYNPSGTTNACNYIRANAARLVPILFATHPIPGVGPSTKIGYFYGEICSTVADPAFNNAVNAQSLSEDALTGTAKLQFNLDKDAMAYASYARGYKAGGFNLDRERTLTPASVLGPSFFQGNTAFPAETVDSYEVGAKTTWLGGNLLLDAALFDQKYQGFQFNTFTGIQFVVTSIPKVESRGLDFDSIWQTPVQGLSFNGGATYADTKFGRFDPKATPGTNALQPGRRFPFAPLWALSLTPSYEFPLFRNYLLRASVTGKYNSTYNTGSDVDPGKIQPGFWTANARVSFGPDNGAWSLELFGQNVFDQRYIQVAFDEALLNNIGAFPGAPAIYGATLRLHF